MGKIAKCDWCGQENTKATEEFEYLPLSQEPNVCWRCGIAVPFIREQIAREIEAKCRNETKTFDYEGGFITVSGCLEYFDNEVWGGFYRATCSHFEDAAIARGEK